MSNKIAYRIYGRHEGREKDSFFGAFYTEEEARAEIEVLQRKVMGNINWANHYHNLGFEIRAATVTTDFEIPPRPAPRERFCVRTTPKYYEPNTRSRESTVVEVLERDPDSAMLRPICTYERHYAMLQTFEPFRQAGRDYALISQKHAYASVLDLATGEMIAHDETPGLGFCPVGFYVPDWWDVHNGATIPGSEFWDDDHEWPTGNFGFIWGCHWGDDSTWKVQYLDLSRVREGVIRREERFGYVELATMAYANPCLTTERPNPAMRSAPPFIHVSRRGGFARANFAVEMGFDLDSGEAMEWIRTRNINLD